MTEKITPEDAKTLESVLEKWNAVDEASTMEEVWRSTPDHCHDIYCNASALVEKLKRMAAPSNSEGEPRA